MKVKVLIGIYFVLLMGRKSLCLAPYYMEYYSNYRNNISDDKLNYRFRYFIDYNPTMVHMMHIEERNGDKVVGQYGLLEPNGLVRSVHYQVVGDTGFQSVVHTRTPYSTTHIRLMNTKQPITPVVLNPPVAAVA